MNLNKSKPDKFKKLVLKQDEPKKPATLGTPVENLNYAELEDEPIAYYTVISEKDRQAYVHTPIDGTFFKLLIDRQFSNHPQAFIATIHSKTQFITGLRNAFSVQFIQFSKDEVKDESKVEGTTK